MTGKIGFVAVVAFACAVGLLAAAPAQEEEDKKPEWQKLLLSVDPRVIGGWSPTGRPEREAMIAASTDVKEAYATVRAQREATIAALLDVVASPVQDHEEYWYADTPRNTAIRLLGELRAEEAVPALIPWLWPRRGQWTGLPHWTMSVPPAGEALISIGRPAVPSLVQTLALTGVSAEDKRTWVSKTEGGVTTHQRVGPPPERYSPLGDLCLEILVYTVGLEEAEAPLARAVQREEDDEGKQNLEDALSALSRPFLREKLGSWQARWEESRHEEAVAAAREAVEARRQWDAAQ